MRLIAALFAAALLLGGCGIGPGEEHEGGAVIHVTRDFGHKELGSATTKTLREDQTVMRLTTEKFDVSTRFGGRFVQSIDGLKGQGAGGSRDWFFFVNGVESEIGAAEYELSSGDRVQWDYRDWDTAMRVPAIVGSFPAPFLTGIDGKRRPVRLECDDDGGHAHRGVPAAVVPLDPIARGQVVLGGTDLRLDAVHEEEPVAHAGRPGALQPVYLLHEASAEARLDVEVRLGQPHHRLAVPDGLGRRGAQHGVPEVAGHAHLRPAGPLLARADPAAGQEQRGEEQGGDTSHGTSTRSPKERTSPCFVATTE